MGEYFLYWCRGVAVGAQEQDGYPELFELCSYVVRSMVGSVVGKKKILGSPVRVPLLQKDTDAEKEVPARPGIVIPLVHRVEEIATTADCSNDVVAAQAVDIP